MQQWQAEYAVETTAGPETKTATYYLPSKDDVRAEVAKEGGYVLSIREHKRSPIERMLARSSWWQIQLLRGIQFRANTTSPSVALWRMIEAETNPRRQNILSPAREALNRGLGVIDAIKALRIFDHSTIAILAGSERSNRLHEGIPHAIQNIAQKRKNMGKIGATLAWLGIDILSITQAMFWGKGFILDWFRKNEPSDPDRLAEYTATVDSLETLWNVLIATAVAAGAFLAWSIASYWINRGKRDWPTARIVRKIPLIGAYMRDLGFADSASAAARMLRGNVPISDTLEQAAEATTVPEISKYWRDAHEDLSRGVALGAALDRDPLNKNERMEIMSVSDLDQVATVLESISDMRAGAAKTKHSLIVWLAFGLSGIYLLIAFGSAIYALTVMNMSMDSLMEDLMMGAM
jgi:type II secretory pathway component PulF